MPLKKGDIKSSLKKKGFVEDKDGPHISYSYDILNKKRTRIKTYVSHGRDSQDVDNKLIGFMARQVKLTNKDFKRLISCEMDQDEYEKVVRNHL